MFRRHASDSTACMWVFCKPSIYNVDNTALFHWIENIDVIIKRRFYGLVFVRLCKWMEGEAERSSNRYICSFWFRIDGHGYFIG